MKMICFVVAALLVSLEGRAEKPSEPGPRGELIFGARAVPAFEDGTFVGFQFVGMTRETSLARQGVQNGDVMTKIDGKKIDSPENLLAAVSGDKGHLSDVEIIRKGQRVQLRLKLAVDD